MRRTLLFLLIFFLTSCVQDTGQIEPAVYSTEEPRKNLSSLEEAKFTPTPSSTPDIPSERLKSKYELPVWMKLADTEIMAVLISDDIQKMRSIAFFNASSGVRYDISLPDDVSGFFWYDNANFGFLSKDLKTMYLLNLSTGQVVSEDVDPHSVRLLDPEWTNGLEMIQEGLNGSVFTFYDQWGFDNSKTKRFTLEKNSEWTGIKIIDNTTNKTVWELTTLDGFYVTDYEWSPVDEEVLAFVQGKPDLPTDIISKEMTLNVVKVSTGELLGSYSGDFGRISWSPDGGQILHLNGESAYSNYGVGFLEAPCILSVDTGKTRCLTKISKLVPPGYELESTGRYEWSANGRSISYSYLYYSLEDHAYQGNFCIYSLDDENIHCPIQNLEEWKNRGISGSLSPSEQYIHVCISDSTMLNDYAGTSEDGIIKVDGTGFFSWISHLVDGGPDHVCTSDALWRPLP
jgi:hypothetical protein